MEFATPYASRTTLTFYHHYPSLLHSFTFLGFCLVPSAFCALYMLFIFLWDGWFGSLVLQHASCLLTWVGPPFYHYLYTPLPPAAVHTFLFAFAGFTPFCVCTYLPTLPPADTLPHLPPPPPTCTPVPVLLLPATYTTLGFTTLPPACFGTFPVPPPFLLLQRARVHCIFACGMLLHAACVLSLLVHACMAWDLHTQLYTYHQLFSYFSPILYLPRPRLPTACPSLPTPSPHPPYACYLPSACIPVFSLLTTTTTTYLVPTAPPPTHHHFLHFAFWDRTGTGTLVALWVLSRAHLCLQRVPPTLPSTYSPYPPAFLPHLFPLLPAPGSVVVLYLCIAFVFACIA